MDLSGTIGVVGSLTGSVSTPAKLSGQVYKSDIVYDKDYEKLENKPSVNSKVLIGNRSLYDLGVDTLIHEEVKTMSNADIEALIGGF